MGTRDSVEKNDSLLSIEQNFYFVQLSMDFKMPLSIGLFIESRHTVD